MFIVHAVINEVHVFLKDNWAQISAYPLYILQYLHNTLLVHWFYYWKLPEINSKKNHRKIYW